MKVYYTSSTSELADLTASLITGNPLEKTAIFCEDKFTLALELAVAKKQGGTFGVNVYSFNRFMHKFLPEDKKCLSQESCALVVKRLLLDNKDSLLCFKNVYDPNLASTVYELIAQLKSAKVTPYDLERARDESTGNLKRKLSDIALLFCEYEKYINQNGLTDGNNRLYRLPEFFNGDSEIKQTKVIIAGFPSLNKTLCEIFKSLVKNAKDICFAVVAGDNKNIYTNETFNFVMKEYAPELCEQKTFEVKQKLLDTLFVPGLNTDEKYQTDAIYHFKAKNPEDEIKRVAKYIRKSVINGARYKDFAITCENLGDYELIVKRVFADYEIPCFFDSNKNLSTHPLTRLVCAYIDVVRTNFDTEKVLAFVKNPLFCPDKDLADNFEKYYINYVINRKTVKQPFEYEDEHLLEYETLRVILCKVCEYLPKNTTFANAVDAINKMIETLNVSKRIEILSKKLEELKAFNLASYNQKGFDAFNKVLEESVNLLGTYEFSLVNIKNVILSGMTACEVFLIPESNDCVFVGDFRSVKYGGYNTVFAVGLCNGVPSSKLDTALLCDRDIDQMQKCEVLVEPKIKEVNRRSRETACMALASFNNRLVVSYSETGSDGKESLASETFLRIKDIFTLPESAKQSVQPLEEILASDYLTSRTANLQFAKQVNEYKEGKEESIATFEGATAYYTAVKEKGENLGNVKAILDSFLNSANTEIGYYTEGVNYYRENRGLSATTIEGYFYCPYRNFLQRGLKIEDVRTNEIEDNTLGNLFHKVAECFVNEVDFCGKITDALSLADRIFEEVIAGKRAENNKKKYEYSRYTKSKRGEKSYEFIKKECMRFCEDLFNGVVNSKYKPNNTEMRFGVKNNHYAIIPTPTGNKKLSGVIDRVDLYDGNFRIVDYKSGKVDEGKIEENLYSGKKLQLFLYANTLEKYYDKKLHKLKDSELKKYDEKTLRERENKPNALGVYYFPVSGDFFEEDESSVMALSGRTVASESVARDMDTTINDENLNGTYVDVSIKTNKDGSFSSNKVLKREELSELLKYSEMVAGNALEEIDKGVIVASPAEESVCDYCNCHGICGYQKIDNKERTIEWRETRNKKRDEIKQKIFNAVKNDQDKEDN